MVRILLPIRLINSIFLFAGVKVKFYVDKPKTFSMAKAASEIERI